MLVRGAISFRECHLFNDCDFYFGHYFLPKLMVRHESLVIFLRCWFIETFSFYLLSVKFTLCCDWRRKCSVAFSNMMKTVFTFAQLELFLWRFSEGRSVCCLWLHAEQIHSWLMNIGICRPWSPTCCWSQLKRPWSLLGRCWALLDALRETPPRPARAGGIWVPWLLPGLSLLVANWRNK